MLSNKCITADNFKKLLQRIKHDITDPAVSVSNKAMEDAATAKEVAEGIDSKATDAVNKANIAVVTANNAAEYATQAAESASNAETYAATAKEVAEGIDAKATQAMEDAATAKEKVDNMTSVYQIKGSVTFEELPLEVMPGWVYNISNDFITTSDFIEGASIECKAGTNIVAVNTGTDDTPVLKWDILSVGVSIDYATTADIESIF